MKRQHAPQNERPSCPHCTYRPKRQFLRSHIKVRHPKAYEQMQRVRIMRSPDYKAALLTLRLDLPEMPRDPIDRIINALAVTS